MLNTFEGRIMQIFRALLAMAVMMTGSTAMAQLKDGETIVFLGDSITKQGAGEKGYVTLFQKAVDKARPDSGIKVIGAGIGGHKVPDLEKRLEKDVLAHKPNVVVIYIGINDVWHSQSGRGTAIDAYETGLTSLIKRCQDAGARVILATPSVIGEKTDGTNGLDEMLEDYAAVSRKVAAAGGATLLDLRAAFSGHLRAYNVAGEKSGILTTDGVHLNDEGNRFVAVRMLEAVGERAVKTRVLRHLVMFKFKPEVAPKKLDEINAAFRGLQNGIAEIQAFERGTNNSPEKLDKGFTHGYLVTFASEADRDAYLPHAEHKKFVELIGGSIDDVLVFDYWTIE